VRVEDERRLTGLPVTDYPRSEDAVVDIAYQVYKELVEYLLVFDPLLIVYPVDRLVDRALGKIEPRVDHRPDRGVDRFVLHPHEVGQRVVEIEDDEFYHDALSACPAFRPAI
jgi:hypothetical protein